MKFIELAEKRRSIRSFKTDAVPDELLNEVLQAGILAPTAKNLQPFQFIVVRAEAGLDALAAAYPAPFFREAPVAIVACVVSEQGWVRSRHDDKNYAEVDTSIAIDHMSLAATDLGLGTCWIGAYDPVAVSQVMDLPENVSPLAILLVGYPNEAGRDKNRKSLKELVRYERW